MNPQRNVLCILLMAFAGCGLGPESESAPQLDTTSQAIQGGVNDDGTPAADVVVYLLGSNCSGGTCPMCSGTLITPTAVLTAKHCIMGDSQGKPPLGNPITIGVGNRLSTGWVRTYVSNSNDVIGARTTFQVDDCGADIAVVWLDPFDSLGRPQYAWDYADIRRPTLVSPCALNESCPDANGGRYAVPFGMAGWSPVDTSDYRKVAYQDLFHHYPGNGGQYWEREQNFVATHPGDSGSPLFNPASGYRDVIGVLSGKHTTYRFPFESVDWDRWTDITRGAPADWLRQIMTDNTHSPSWNAQHPSHLWKGEFDYTGPCQPSRDADCDHWYNEHDNCPYTFNPDQTDTRGNGVGDACRPPPAAPSNCRASVTCNDHVWVDCDDGGDGGVVLQRLINGNWLWVANDSHEVFGHPSMMDIPWGADSATYRACATAWSGLVCGSLMFVTLPHVTCGPDVPPHPTPGEPPACHPIDPCDCGRCPLEI